MLFTVLGILSWTVFAIVAVAGFLGWQMLKTVRGHFGLVKSAPVTVKFKTAAKDKR